MPISKEYRWNNPQEWLLEKARDEWTPEELLSAFNEIVGKLDGDTIQDIFQHEMDGDGFFNLLHIHTIERDPWDPRVKRFKGDEEDCPICEEEKETEPRCIGCGMTKAEGHAEDCGHIDCAPEMEDTHCFIKQFERGEK